MSPALRSILFAGDFLHFSPEQSPLFRGLCPGGTSSAAGCSSPFSGIVATKVLVFGDYGAADLCTPTRGMLSSLPGVALCSARSALRPSITFAGRAVDAAPGYIRLSACAGLPAPHKITSCPPIGGAQRCTALGKAPRAASAFRAARARGIRARSGLAAYFFL